MSGRSRMVDWLAHVETAQREGKTLAEYAREHGLPAHGMYKAQQRMGRKLVQATPMQGGSAKPIERQDCASPFVEVKMASPPAYVSAMPARLSVRLPNGVEIELECDGSDANLLVALMDALGRTPCSASTRT